MVLKVVKDWLVRSNKVERLWLLAKIEFKLRYYENKLGLLWALIKPLIDMAIYYVVFQMIIKQNIPAFASYLFIGLILWNFFIESTTGTIQILNTKKYLYEYSNMNKLEIYISTLFSNSIGFFFNFIVFLVVYNFLESESAGVSIYNLWIIIVFINLFLLSLGMSLILSTVYIVAKDIYQIWQPISTFLFFLSPIFYKLTTFMDTMPALAYINPMSAIVINARKIMIDNSSPNYELLGYSFGYAFFLLLLGLILLNKLGSKAAEKL